tara:strand:- start:11752 stop:12156 length:405 start_codon:yes stop_codon:yes gene_type:complete
MIVTGQLPNYKSSIYNVELSIDSPESGFALSLLETGIDGSFKTANLITFSGYDGYLFDQSGNFFGGYASGTPFELTVYYDQVNKTFNYYHDDTLMANSLDVTGDAIFGTSVVTMASFEKHGDSSASILVSGIKN